MLYRNQYLRKPAAPSIMLWAKSSEEPKMNDTMLSASNLYARNDDGDGPRPPLTEAPAPSSLPGLPEDNLRYRGKAARFLCAIVHAPC